MAAAAVCGKRRYTFEEGIPEAFTYTPIIKKNRCGSFTSPDCNASWTTQVCFPPAPAPRTALVDKISQTFPHVDRQVLDKVLKQCGDDLDAAIKRLHEDDCWVDLFVTEMQSATNMDDARARTKSMMKAMQEVLVQGLRQENLMLKDQNQGLGQENIQKSNVVEGLSQENLMLKEQNQGLGQENIALKQKNQQVEQQNNVFRNAIRTQHERVKDYDQLKQKVHDLERDNYTLRSHLYVAQPCILSNRDHFPPPPPAVF